jgi:Tol biopolymer transport system component
VASIEGEGARRITNDAARDQGPLWHSDGRIVYSSNISGISQICVTDKDAHNPAQLTFVNSDCRASDVSKDKILFLSSKEESDIWEVKIDTGREVQLTYDVGSEFWPDISPDGKRVAFQAVNVPNIAGALTNSLLLSKPVRGGGQQINLAPDGFYPKWSPDGSRVAFLRISDGQINIWTARATGGDEKQVTKGGVWFGGFSILPYNRRMIRDYCWSPDGSKILFCSNKNNQNNIRTISAGGLDESDILSDPDPDLIYLSPIWSLDFTRIAFVTQRAKPSSDGKTIWGLGVTEGGKSKTIFQSDSLFRLVGWTHSGGDLIVGLVEGKDKFQAKTADITLLKLSTSGDRQVIAQLPSAYFPSFEMSPDGRAIAFVAQQDGKDNICLISINESQPRKITSNTDIRTHFSSLDWSIDGSKLYYDKQEKRSLVSMIENFN